MSAISALEAAVEDWRNRALLLEAENARLKAGLEIIASKTYPARYMGRRLDGVEVYGDSDDPSRFARSLLGGSQR